MCLGFPLEQKLAAFLFSCGDGFSCRRPLGCSGFPCGKSPMGAFMIHHYNISCWWLCVSFVQSLMFWCTTEVLNCILLFLFGSNGMLHIHFYYKVEMTGVLCFRNVSLVLISAY
jgi:hypothetical protein